MRIALLTPFHQRELNRTDDYFLLTGWEQALSGHDTYRLPRFEAPSFEVKRILPDFDLAIVIASAESICLPPLGEQAIAACGVKVLYPNLDTEFASFRPEWFVKAEALSQSIPKPIFCPERRHLSLSREIYAELNRWQPTLFMGNETADLKSAGGPGFRTLFAPFFPEAHVKALASASFVVTLNKTIALSAASLRVPVLFVTDCENESDEMVRLGMETIVFGAHEPASSVAKRVKAKAAGGLPLVTETTCQSQLAREANKVISVFAPRPTPFLENEEPLNVGCIADWRYVPFLLGLAANLRSVHRGPVRLFVLAMDDQTARFLTDGNLLDGGEVYGLSDFWEPHSLKLLQYRSMAYQAYTCKPKILQKILDVTGAPAIYCDLDLFYYESPAAWLRGLGEKAVLVCPQRNELIEFDRFYGFFQAGLIAVNERAKTFLEWWGRLSFYKCLNTRRTHDYFMEDQGYLDLAPVLFAEFGIDWSGEQNVAPWNVSAHCAFPDPQTPWRPVLRDGAMSKSLHAAHSDKLKFAHAKFVWDQISLFFSAYPETDADELLPQVVTTQAPYFGPLCYLFEFETTAHLYFRTPKWFENHPKRFLALWHSPLRGVATLFSNFLSSMRKARRAKIERSWVKPPARIRRSKQRRSLPPLNWAEMVATLIKRKKEIEALEVRPNPIRGSALPAASFFEGGIAEFPHVTSSDALPRNENA